MQHIDSDLIRGNIDTIILKTMLNEDKYGLDIIKEVGEKSSGTYELKQPTLYSCLKRLENQELISSYWVDSDIGGRRHYYKLTDKGREFYNKKQEEWAKSKFIIDNLLSNYDYEEYRLVKKDEFDEMLQKKANAPLSSFGDAKEEPNSEQKIESFEKTQTQEETDTEISSEEEIIEEPIEAEETESTETINDDSDDEISEKYKVEIIEDDDEEYGTYYREQSSYSNTEDEDFDYEEDDAVESEEDDEFSSFETIEDLETYLKESSNGDEDDDEDDIFSLGENDSSNDFENDAFDDETVELGETEDNDYPVYFSANKTENKPKEINTVSYETNDQSSNELNFLRRLHGQENEEINTYYGDQKSYINHLNQLDESQLEQQDLLDSSLYVKPDLVNKSIDEFADAIDRLNNFVQDSSQLEEELEEEPSDDFNAEQEVIAENNPNNYPQDDEIDDLDELNKLKNLSSNAFFYSNDNSSYDAVNKTEETNFSQNLQANDYNLEHYESEEFTNYQSFEEISNEIEPRHNEYAMDSIETQGFDDEQNCFNDNSEHLSDIDTIISNNITATYPEPTQHFYKTQSVNYREKLSDLSRYSKVALDEEKTEVSNADAIKKAKDIAEITKELEEEGIRIREHYKSSNIKGLDKNYLLANKINLVKSLIVFFGYVFVLSALYIVLNNTAMKDNSWFSIKPFLIGFIPFAIIFVYHAILFAINPYKKVDAKYHSRIMLFISVIITIQLLLITYCINLQLGFYSFSQKGYNHLFWIVPTIITFAPIIDNLVYLALFKSKNFNV